MTLSFDKFGVPHLRGFAKLPCCVRKFLSISRAAGAKELHFWGPK